MRLVSPLLKKVVYPAMHHSGWLKRSARLEGCAVVNYHGVIPAGYQSEDAFLDGNLVTLEGLRSQIRFLKTNYDVVSPDEFRDWISGRRNLPLRAVLLTCDDGLANNLLDMVPLLRSEGVQCLFFVLSASTSENPGMLWYEELYHLLRVREMREDSLKLFFEDSEPPDASAGFVALWWKMVLRASRWTARERADRIGILRSRCPTLVLTSAGRRWRLMNIHELRQLEQSDMTIGAHTTSHPVLSEASEEESWHEIHESKVELERVLGRPVWAFAYPFGNADTMGAREVNLARKSGFECGFLNVGGGFSDRFQPLTFPRTHVTNDMSVAEVEAHMIGFHARLQRAVRG